MRIYLASPLSNAILNADLARRLEARGWDCFLPQRDAVQSDAKNNVVARNIKAIQSADLIVLVTEGLGIDTAWEVGFATALGKPVIMLEDKNDAIRRSHMIRIGSSGHIVRDYPSLERLISKMEQHDELGVALPR
ncbi:MAG TPA: nucleoside 2-deoxyribosyltransferase [Rhizomicrobium sp.]|nr:nucleoside 2-deoxyribosyltransferase [Rhizomicrobium sp.]